MRTALLLFKALLFAFLIVGCEPDDAQDGDGAGEIIVVEGFVYADEPIKRIKLSKFHEGGRSQTIPVSDAQVTAEQAGVSFALEVSDFSPGLYIQTDTSEVPGASAPVSIRITYGGRRYTASSSMPSGITGLQISEPEIEFSGHTDEVLTELSWDPQPGGKYCVFLREIEVNITLEGPEFVNPSDAPFGRVLTNNSLELKASHFPSTGRFALYVTAVNDDYVQLYESPEGMNLTGASGNISGGVGVFTAFNGTSVLLEIN